MANSLAKNSFFNFFGNAIYAVAMLVFMPLLIREMGAEEYALFKLSMFSILSYIVLLELGVQTGARRALAEAYSTGNISELKRTLGNTYFVYIFVTLVIFIISVPIIYFAPDYFEVSAELRTPFKLILAATIYYIIYTLIATPLFCILYIFGRYDYCVIPNLLGRVSFVFVGLMLSYLFGNSLIMMSIAIIIMPFTSFPLLLHYVKDKTFPEFGIDFSRLEKKVYGKILSFGIKMTMLQGSVPLVLSAADIFVGRYLGLKDVTLFAIAILFGNQLLAFIATISDPIFAKICEYSRQHNSKGIADSFKHVIKISTLFFAALSIPCIVFMPEGLGILFGQEYETVAFLACILTIRAIGGIFSSVSFAAFKASGNINKISVYNVLFCAICILMLFVCIKYFNFGLIQVAYLITTLLIAVGILVFYAASRNFNIGFTRITLGVVWILFAAFVLVGIPLYIFKYFLPPSGLYTSLAEIAVACSYSFIVVFFVLSGKELRDFFLNRMKKILRVH